jgi:hypothetical protein
VDGVAKTLQIEREEWGYAKLVHRLEGLWGTGCIESMHYTWYYNKKQKGSGKGEQHMLEDDDDVKGWLEQCESKMPPEEMLIKIRLSENASAANANAAVKTEAAHNVRGRVSSRATLRKVSQTRALDSKIRDPMVEFNDGNDSPVPEALTFSLNTAAKDEVRGTEKKATLPVRTTQAKLMRVRGGSAKVVERGRSNSSPHQPQTPAYS